jgi:alginate O-acetyltransferase complex protein AlgJ
MNTEVATLRIKRCADRVLAVGFCMALVAPAIGTLVTDAEQAITTVERRQAAAFPQLETRRRWGLELPRTGSLVEFPKNFESWFDDHIGLRRPLIQAYQLAKVYGLTVESRAVTADNQAMVTVGRDGWLFLTGGGLIEDFRRTTAFPPEELAAWKTCLARRRAWSAGRGIEFLALAAPTAQSIYPEYMPRNFKRADRPSRLDELVAAMRDVPDFVLIDPRSALSERRSEYPTYLKTDGYWNDFGALLAYEQLMDRCAAPNRPMPRVTLADFEVRIEEVVDQGNLAKLLNSPVAFREAWLTLVPRVPRRAQTEVVGATSDGRTITRTICPQAPGGKAVVLHDSFFKRLAPFVSEQFREVYYIPGLGFPAEEIERIAPDIVIQQFVESKLLSPPPPNPASLSDDAVTAASAGAKRR